MSMFTGLLFAVLASLSWGSVDALRKALAERITPLALATLFAVGKVPGFLIWAIFDGSWDVPSEYILPGLGVVVTALVASILILWALRISPLSSSIPMLSLTPAFAALIAFFLLGETPSGLQLLGIGVVVLGAFLLNSAETSTSRRGWSEPGMWMMVAVAALWAASLTLDKVAMQYTDAATHGVVHQAVIALILIGILGWKGQSKMLRQVNEVRGLFFAAIVLATLATAFQLLAVKTVLVSVVETIKRVVGLSMSMINGRVFFGEKITRRKLVAIVWMTVGVFLLI